eukprot:2668687-Amphidinium_carterae.1
MQFLHCGTSTPCLVAATCSNLQLLQLLLAYLSPASVLGETDSGATDVSASSMLCSGWCTDAPAASRRTPPFDPPLKEICEFHRRREICNLLPEGTLVD